MNYELRLIEFYQAYLAWVKDGGGVGWGVEGCRFNRAYGLCMNLRIWCEYMEYRAYERQRIIDVMLMQFKDAGLSAYKPFQSGVDYDEECRERRCHLNPLRIQWVEVRAK